MEKFQEPKQVTEGMKQGLARMYADPFMREYLVNAVSIAKNNAINLMETKHFDQASAYSSRAKALQQLLDKGKECFVHFESKRDALRSIKDLSETKL